MLILRPYRARLEQNAIIKLIKEELIPLSHTIRKNDAAAIRDLPKQLRRGTTIVASRSKAARPLGFIHFSVVNKQLFIEMLVVHPEHRNKQLGKLLMQAAEKHGLSKHCTSAVLYVDSGNERAQGFYARLGYRTMIFVESLHCFQMEKPLGMLSF
ncbi:GNAT family N-acetyltransferase [Paenibacillaceae bacterium]|nr:GNAT family N-acetyltransferase [Paenibacillaceae bacterium]